MSAAARRTRSSIANAARSTSSGAQRLERTAWAASRAKLRKEVSLLSWQDLDILCSRSCAKASRIAMPRRSSASRTRGFIPPCMRCTLALWSSPSVRRGIQAVGTPAAISSWYVWYPAADSAPSKPSSNSALGPFSQVIRGLCRMDPKYNGAPPTTMCTSGSSMIAVQIEWRSSCASVSAPEPTDT